LLQEIWADHEVAVACHEKAARLLSGVVGQGINDLPMMRIRIVITNPGFEQVAEDVQPIQ